ncbi:hypothetical protein [Diplocloster hominis]|uniref:hypothetical protein n=1 Tax=Diplocloster hominis TaxID=3079010 RepID=UPI0031B9D530
MSKVCLVIVFNHKYNRNIPILEKLYHDRFHAIYYIVPFNQEKVAGIQEEKIIPVYETSYCFQGYFAQAYRRIKNDEYSHYIIIGDDQILNPKLNENNILSELNLGENESFIKNITPYGNSVGDQSNKFYAIISAFRINTGVSYKNEIPSYDEAVNKCRQHGLKVQKKFPLSFFLHKGFLGPKHIMLTLFVLAMNKGRKLPYPLFKSYADMLVIDKSSMDEFCRLSGVFAAMGIFVETAVPVAMVLACNSIKLEENLNGYYGVEKWRDEITDFETEHHSDLNHLLKNFGDNVLYYHPIKLSRWKVE